MSRLFESPTEIYETLSRQVIDQETALRQISVSLYKHLRHIKVGNIMLVGNSGTGKTTIMKAIERMFAEDERMAAFVNVVRMNANLVADDESNHLESGVIIRRLMQNAERLMRASAGVEELGAVVDDKKSRERFRELIENGVVFLDEVDKIRGHLNDRASARGLAAQESLLTFIEGEQLKLPFAYRDEAGELVRDEVLVDTSRVLFIAGGAFEGLYDMVYRRVAGGEHRDQLNREFLVEDKDVAEKEYFSLQQYVRYEDMFDYGMTPQFLGRFDEVIVLNDLTVKGLMRIFVEPPDSLYREARRYFKSLGLEFQITREALQLLAERARDNHRLGARALRSVFKRVLRDVEFDPRTSSMLVEDGEKSRLVVTADAVARLS